MNLSRHKDKLALIFLVIFVAIYAAILLISPKLGPTDDFIFLRTLQSGKPILYYSADFPYYEHIKMGRFSPLIALEYNLVGLFSKSPSPFWYYFIHSIQFIIFAILFVKLLGKITSNKFIVYGSSVLLFLLPGFTFSYFRLQIDERSALFFLTVFILCYLTYLKNQKWYYFLGILLSVNITLYLKETSFIIFGAFAFFHLIFSRKENSRYVKITDILILLSSVIYAGLYYFYIFLPYKGILTYGKNTMPFYTTLIKKIFNYALISDSFIMFVIFPLSIWRVYKIFIKREQINAVFDSMLFSSLMFVFAYLILSLPASVYYLLPIYIFAIPVILHFVKQINNSKILKTLMIAAMFFTLTSSLPLGLHNLTYNKYIAVDFNKTLDFLTNDIKTKYADSRAAIFLDGLNKGSGNWAYFIVSEFLLHRGLTPKQFDLKAQIEDEKVSKLQPLPIAMPKISLPYTVYQGDGASEIKPGDYLIVSSLNTDFSKKNSGDKDYLKSLEKEYDLAFRTKSSFEFPMLTLKEMTRYLLYNFTPTPYTQEGVGVKFLTMDVRKPNFESPDFYVFIKK